MAEKTCFVICPIGEEGSSTRRQSDCVLEYILKPALNGLGYAKPHRVDTKNRPAHITTEIIVDLVKSDLVIADLSDLNANVFYELGVRHAFQKPTILISDWLKTPPFDISGANIIRYTYDDPSSHREVIAKIQTQVNAFDGHDAVSTPVSVALGFQRLSESGDDFKELVARMERRLSRQEIEIENIRESTRQLSRPVLGNRVGALGNHNSFASGLGLQNRNSIWDDE
ncbi:hypothetical protein AADZ90_015510 [Aestuariibius sp. 2305UL40-4]|uniref:hypothetical protein n=1 Tax=Aestuariibius violaceus TaxID=3234132 RepID=UPI00345EE44C